MNIIQKEKAKNILRLGIPATIENVLQTLVGFIDTLMISQIGLTAVTAVGLVNSIINVYLAIFMAVGIGSSSIIARSLGAKDSMKAKMYSSQSFFIAVVCGIFFGVFTFTLGRPLLLLMGAENEVISYAVQFFYIVGGSSLFISLTSILASILKANGNTKAPMVISIFVNITNIVLDYLLIFGIGPFPELGIIGTGLGTMISRMIGSILLLIKVQQSNTPIKLNTILKGSNFSDLLKISIPAALERLVMRLGQVVYFSLIVGLGSITFAAHTIAGNIESFTYMPGYGLATAASVLVGMSIGEGRKKLAQEYAYLSAVFGTIIMSILGILLFFGSPYFAVLFTNELPAIQEVVTALRIDAFIQPGLAISLIITGALQGLGDTKTPLYSTAFGMWIIRVAGVILLGQWLSMGIAGVWVSIGIDLYLRSIFLVYRFHTTTKKDDEN